MPKVNHPLTKAMVRSVMLDAADYSFNIRAPGHLADYHNSRAQELYLDTVRQFNLIHLNALEKYTK